MKKKMVVCDICGREIRPNEDRFKFKHYSIYYIPYGGWVSESWKRKDICIDCYKDFLSFIKNKEKVDKNES